MKGGVNEMTNDAVRFTLRITKAIKQQLNNRSQQMGISVNSLVIQILWDWVAQQTQNLKDE